MAEAGQGGDSVDIVGPEFPESVADGVIAAWHKQPGDQVQRQELLAEVETDKVVLEIMAPVAGTLSAILTPEGTTIVSGQVLAHLAVGTAAAAPALATAHQPVDGTAPFPTADLQPSPAGTPSASVAEQRISPAARRLIAEQSLDASAIEPSGQGGRLLKEDVLRHIAAADTSAAVEGAVVPVAATPSSASGSEEGRVEKRVPMSRLRARIAERLLQVRQNTAMLTTFNELDMGQ